MAKRETFRGSTTLKSPKYFSTLNASEKLQPKTSKLLIDVPEGAPIPPKDSSKPSLIRRSSEDALLAYHQALKAVALKSSPKSTRTLSKPIETPKSRPAANLIGQRSNSSSYGGSKDHTAIERPRSGMNSPKATDLPSSGATPDVKKGKSGTPRAHASKKSAFTPTGSSTPKETTSNRPSTATSSYPTGQQTPKSKTPRQALAPLSHSSKPDSLSSIVTQVKGGSIPGVPKGQELSPSEIKARSEAIYHEHLFQTFQALKFVKMLPQPDPAQIAAKRLNLSKRAGYENKKTIIFDLDETLVHCCEDQATQTADVYLPVVFPTGEVVQAGINIRPFVVECLTEANRDFEVIVFTASHRCYADVVLNYLDPRGELVHHRLYRDNCVVVNGVFIKDLRVINRALTDLVIVDNAAYSFGFQLENGIPIISWRDDRYDRELFNLIDYMKTLAEETDVRAVNSRTFHLSTFYEDYIKEFLSAPGERKLSPKAVPLKKPVRQTSKHRA